ncbi:hypothetical protein H4R33_005420 [Dimargaris cristalligena]|uniref:Uncharacterized protein n=1 Tax=Dimargaris cristalligena TaxID=215637 RepID=A0A4P9ZUZ4_9FUNG|nr:hypothetical protein H4R33_005420 [Dimargaris cristalligena]RKP36642.1 hypothetical protein BJ085DRAFT_40584 [Dimargaris cristalligena]|eukprot:RKP36642.1 hypothetical protein BJ085DRAFT_40584 [Dimargaris cristalligena]
MVDPKPTDSASEPQPPLECNVMRAIDDMFSCSNLKGHALNYYRYGVRRDCKSKSERLKLCLKVNLMSDARRQKILQQYEDEKKQKLLDGPNILDVMSERT